MEEIIAPIEKNKYINEIKKLFVHEKYHILTIKLNIIKVINSFRLSINFSKGLINNGIIAHKIVVIQAR